MEVKTSELKNRALDWAVALAVGKYSKNCLVRNCDIAPEFSKDWKQCGELIDRFAPSFFYADGKYGCELSFVDCMHIADSFQEALCRCVVTFLWGTEVDIPDALVNKL